MSGSGNFGTPKLFTESVSAIYKIISANCVPFADLDLGVHLVSGVHL